METIRKYVEFVDEVMGLYSYFSCCDMRLCDKYEHVKSKHIDNNIDCRELYSPIDYIKELQQRALCDFMGNIKEEMLSGSPSTVELQRRINIARYQLKDKLILLDEDDKYLLADNGEIECKIINVFGDMANEIVVRLHHLLVIISMHTRHICELFNELKVLDTDQVSSSPIETEQSDVTLPPELDTDRARKYLNKAREIGLFADKYVWVKSKSLLACFAREMSLKLDLGKGESSDGVKRISWKPFEILFKVENLRSSYNDLQKIGQDPIGIELIDEIFK